MTLTYSSDGGVAEFPTLDGRRVLGGTAYRLIGVTGIHGLPADVHLQGQYNQVGETYIGSRVNARDITIRGQVIGDSPAEVIENRLHLLEVFHPLPVLHTGQLMVTRGSFQRRIQCVVEQAPAFAEGNGVAFTVGLRAPSPMWEEPQERRVDVSGWSKGFQWPLDIPQGVGIEFGRRIGGQRISVVNPGATAVGMRIEFRASGYVKWPTLENVGLGSITVREEMAAGDRIVISTMPGSKSARMYPAGSANRNVYKSLSPADAVGMQLLPWENVFEATAEQGGLLLDTSIYFSPQYVGV